MEYPIFKDITPLCYGNKPEQVAEHLQTLIDSIENAKTALLKSDHAHARNAKDSQHANTMRTEQKNDLETLNKLAEKYSAIQINIIYHHQI